MKIFLSIFLAILTACSVEQINVSLPTPTPISPVPAPESNPPEPPAAEKVTQIPQNTPRTKGLVEKKVENYLLSREIKPLLTIENDYNGARKERVEEIKVSNHKIIWFHSLEISKLEIDGDLILLKDKVSLNNADGEDKINGNIVNQWYRIKFFKFRNRALIGIEMGQDFCTGLMCSVSFFLVYDLANKTQNYFGDFRINNELKLYDFGKDGTIDFLSSTNNFTSTPGFEVTQIYNFYTLDEKGVLQFQKDKNDKPYFIKRVFSSDNDEEYNDKFKQHWIEEIELRFQKILKKLKK